MSSIVHKAVAVAAGLGGIVGLRGGTEEPRYTLQARVGAIEIRVYPERLAAETQVDGGVVAARSAGFSRIAGFIFGANSGRQTIAMTAPVAQAPVNEAGEGPALTGSKSWRIQFFMPASWTRTTLPRPNDPAVHIVTVPAQTYAVLRFSGSTAASAVAAKQASLMEALSATGWHACAAPVAWFYDPPWTLPPLRRNEVAVCVKAA